MTLFISWSGTQSQKVAKQLVVMLKQLFPNIKSFMSEQQIEIGQRPLEIIANELKESDFGIICVTEESIIAPWVLFEAGCISKKCGISRLMPYMINIDRKLFQGNPLEQFQNAKSDKKGTYKLVTTIYTVFKEFTEDHRNISEFKEHFELVWNKYKEKIDKIKDEHKEKSTNINQIKKPLELIQNIRSYISYHQGKLIEYLFFAGEEHKKLKKEFSKKEKNAELIKNIYMELTNSLNSKIFEVAEYSFEVLQTYFRGRRNMAPRICLRANNFEDDNQKILTYYRSPGSRVAYSKLSDCLIKENRAFLHILATPGPYMCNKIPEEAGKGDYENPRLKIDEVKKYLKKVSDKRLKSSSIDDSDWRKCWKRISVENKKIANKPEHCYKSTLIIPLTLLDNTLSDGFIKNFKMKDIGDRVFGYLCLDHVEPEYFSYEMDTNIGYIFAKLLSHYFLIYFMFINQSKTRTNIISEFGESFLEL
ncbi:MAG: hypothetical protein GY710_26300 [Desulfobacteraceae bacterium]|nr:hypothetical protein [Desulfobacteraceae bacterium]